jgi:hypothetical protein
MPGAISATQLLAFSLGTNKSSEKKTMKYKTG